MLYSCIKNLLQADILAQPIGRRAWARICKRLIGIGIRTAVVNYDILSGGKPSEPPSSSFILHQAEIQDLEFFSVNFIISVIKKKAS
jgi:hypothetical protein